MRKDRAVEIASSIKGVLSVVDRMNVRPMEREDDKLHREVERYMEQNPVVDAGEIDVSVEGGVVYLSGTVSSMQEKQYTTKIIKSISGVRDKKNEILVDEPEERPEEEIRLDIKSRLKMDVKVDADLIEVNVNNTTVTLAGTVGSVAEKKRAKNDAWVQGVKEVKAENLTVNWELRDDMRRNSSMVNVSDQQISKALAGAFYYHPLISPYAVQVDVRHGKVRLKGVVKNIAAKHAAEQTAMSTVGVRRVLNFIRVRPDIIPSDNELEQNVKNALSISPYVDRLDIKVQAVNGEIILSGTVNSLFEKQHAGELASEVTGVMDLNNNLEVEGYWAWKDDIEIKEDIVAYLEWNSQIDNENIDVKVQGGVVTLSGTVTTWNERRQAAQYAIKAGAEDVINNIQVKKQQTGQQQQQQQQQQQ